jgi:hypothetical protein
VKVSRADAPVAIEMTQGEAMRLKLLCGNLSHNKVADLLTAPRSGVLVGDVNRMVTDLYGALQEAGL